MESQNGNLKDGLPEGYQGWPLQAIQPLVESSILANGIKKGWSDESCNVSDSWQPYSAYLLPVPAFVGGSFVQCDRVEIEEDLQRKVPCAAKYATFLPHSMTVSTCSDTVLLGGVLKPTRVYSYNFDTADGTIDEQTHLAFLEMMSAPDQSALMAACKKLRLLRDDGDLHLPNFRGLLAQVCQCYFLATPWNGCRICCTCSLAIVACSPNRVSKLEVLTVVTVVAKTGA